MIVNNITSNSLSISTPAKINLFLEVLNRRDDGFHNINSVFQTVSLFDNLLFKVIDEPTIKIKLSNKVDIPVNKNNLIFKVFTSFSRKYNVNRGLSVELEKNIPVAAGLGGGSSDAASTIMACNLLFGTRLSVGEMVNLSLEVGSDIPFFFGNGTAKVTGRGEIVEDQELPLDYHLVLINPGIRVSTAESYAKLKRGLTNSKLPFNLARCGSAEEMISSLKLAGNDFEENVFNSYPQMVRVKTFLEECGADLVRMSGSGSTMFGLFNTKPVLNSASLVSEGSWRIDTVKPIVLKKIAQ
jgi:4-diphosphocytidyl-2-C-methyl-D-erythritol kinase